MGHFKSWGAAVLGAALLCSPDLRADEVKSATLSYHLDVTPEGATVTAEAKGIDPKAVTGFAGRGLIGGTEVKAGKGADSLSYRYKVPVDSGAIRKAGNPYLVDGRFTAFGSGLFLFPKIPGVLFRDVKLQIKKPDGWALATSRGEGAEYEFPGMPDLMGLLICAGDYKTYGFEIPHHDTGGKPNGKVTKVHVAIHGERDWEDGPFVDEFRRIVTAQMHYFGGAHPAPEQFLALHICPGGKGPQDVPAFNRRAPGHDTILAYHTPQRPRESFEFLGMLSHEHMHNWFPYAMKANLGPWFMEGLNDYVAYRCLMSEGLHGREQFAGMLSKWHREYLWVLDRPGHALTPYRRGMIAGWVLDIELRRSSDGKVGLRHVLLEVLNNPPADGVVKREHLVAALNKAAGKDFETLYEELVENDAAIDLAQHLKGSGFHIVDPKSGAIRIAPETDGEKALLEAVLK